MFMLIMGVAKKKIPGVKIYICIFTTGIFFIKPSLSHLFSSVIFIGGALSPVIPGDKTPPNK